MDGRLKRLPLTTKIPLPKSHAHRWWVRRGMWISATLFTISFVLLVVDEVRNDSSLRGWAAWIGTIAAVAAVDTIGQRIIVRLTQVIALWYEDVPAEVEGEGRPRPRQNPFLDAEDVATVTRLYRDDEDEASR